MIRPGQLLQQIRDHYCDRLRAAIDDFVSDGIITMTSEAVLRNAAGVPVRRGEPPTPARVDLITLVNGQVRDGLTIESDTMPSFPPITLQWEHVMPVKIGPFPWNACDVQFSGDVKNWTPLAAWFEAMFDGEETKKPGDDGLIGVVHTLTRLKPDLWQIDFGSSDIDAFEGMIDAMKRCGAERLLIGKIGNA